MSIAKKTFLSIDELCLHLQKFDSVVFTNGCFDILHVGHVSYLEQAAALGDILVVGVNDDASVKRLKGESRPVQTTQDRLTILAALESVGAVIPFAEDTPLELIKKIKPDILVKGGDYTIDQIVGADLVSASGGLVKTIPFVTAKSTTSLLKKLDQ